MRAVRTRLFEIRITRVVNRATRREERDFSSFSERDNACECFFSSTRASSFDDGSRPRVTARRAAPERTCHVATRVRAIARGGPRRRGPRACASGRRAASAGAPAPAVVASRRGDVPTGVRVVVRRRGPRLRRRRDRRRPRRHGGCRGGGSAGRVRRARHALARAHHRRDVMQPLHRRTGEGRAGPRDRRPGRAHGRRRGPRGHSVPRVERLQGPRRAGPEGADGPHRVQEGDPGSGRRNAPAGGDRRRRRGSRVDRERGRDRARIGARRGRQAGLGRRPARAHRRHRHGNVPARRHTRRDAASRARRTRAHRSDRKARRGGGRRRARAGRASVRRGLRDGAHEDGHAPASRRRVHRLVGRTFDAAARRRRAVAVRV